MAGLLFGPRRALLGGLDLADIFKFDESLSTFTPNMDKRAAPGPFAAAPIVQGFFTDDSQVGDELEALVGDTIINDFRANIDHYQGSVVLWFTPERDILGDGEQYRIYRNSDVTIRIDTAGNLGLSMDGIEVAIDVTSWTAGTTYHLVFRWDTKNTLDGTNYACISVNNVHTFGISTAPSIIAPGTYFNIGCDWNNTKSANAIIEGLTVYRRVLHDGTNGIAANWDDTGPINEIEAIWAAGSGKDPCLVTGSWGVVFCLPTNSTQEALVTGTGEAWSHPHSSGVLEHQWLEDGGYLSEPWAVLYNGSNTNINCSSGATLDDIPAAGGEITIGVWLRLDPTVVDNYGIISKHSYSDAGYFLRVGTGGRNRPYFIVRLATTDIGLQYVQDVGDGKWHYIVAHYDDATKTATLAVDGVWGSPAVGAGAYLSDAARNLVIGDETSTGQPWDGAIGWVALWSDDHHVAGTDFVPPRTAPTLGGNLVEAWHSDEGTGATATAEVTSPGNDGTLSNGTWEEQWDQETSPIVPYVVDSNKNPINCGSGATLDDIPQGAQMTIEGWFKITEPPTSYGVLAVKTDYSSLGWEVQISHQNGKVLFGARCATTDAEAASTGDYRDGKWHHFAITYNDAVGRRPVIWMDGIDDTLWDTAGDGVMSNDNTRDFITNNLAGSMGWCRFSNNIRYTDTFTPPSRLNPPGADGNTVEQWNYRDGAGTVLTALVTSPGADGYVSANSEWQTTPDIEIDSPAERIFNWGYVMGNDAVDEGIYETIAGLDAGENYVVRAVASLESASRGRPKIIIYDETNSAQITALEGPSCFGQHDGGAAAANLTDTTARWPQMLVAWTVYNITDGSSATITAISGDGQTITAALSGGTDDLWDISDEYRIVPPGGPGYYDDYPWIETFCFELPTITRNGVGSDCASISVKLVNGVNEGVIKWHQIELLEVLIDNPSLDTFQGTNPDIPDGWTNTDLAIGDTQAEASIIHSGVRSMRWNVGSQTKEMSAGAILTADKFYGCGMWTLGDGSVALQAQRPNLHSLAAFAYFNASTAQYWVQTPWVGRALANWAVMRGGEGVPSGPRYIDDYFIYQLDDVSLTVTPASQINSAESGGLRVDGRDSCTQPIPAGILTATSGWIKWKMIFRHSAGDFTSYQGGLPYSIRAVEGGGNYIYVYSDVATNIRFAFDDGGGVHFSASFDATGIIVANIEYLFEIKYTAAEMILKIDGITRITITTPINFGAVVDAINWGYYGGSSGRNIDAVFKAP